MPELPDLIYFERYIDRHGLGHPIEQVHLYDADQLLRDVSETTLRRRLQGRSLDSTRRYGKYLFGEITGDGWLVLHFGMTGEPVVHFEDNRPDHTKLELEFDDGSRLSYVNVRKLGEIGLAADPDDFADERDLGPDALSDQLDPEAFTMLLVGRSGMLKTRLMDQSVIAGIGNVYSDEILFQNRLPPRVEIEDLDDDDLEEVGRTIRRVLEECGDQFPTLEELADRYLVTHRLDDGDGQCPQCGSEIERVDVGGRAAQYCPSCQQ
ncbi:MAG: DNA-formamidopyrimidine glycosylase family protein [Bradymonadaceae bacterium]